MTGNDSSLSTPQQQARARSFEADQGPPAGSPNWTLADIAVSGFRRETAFRDRLPRIEAPAFPGWLVSVPGSGSITAAGGRW
jgi:hypothetical protein